MNALTVIGGGMGSEALLTREARSAICGAGRIFATRRMAEAYRCLNPEIKTLRYSEILEELERGGEDASVIVSGDRGFFSLSRALTQRFQGVYRIRHICGLGAVQMFSARMGVEYDDCKVISTHGRSASVLGPASYHPRLFVLPSGGEEAGLILRRLCGAGLEDIAVCAGEALGTPDERLYHGTAEELADKQFAGPLLLFLRNSRCGDLCGRLRDEDFVRADVPMTKEPVRALTVYRLGVEPGDVVYDIGAGTGSVAVALAREARDGVVFAVERSAPAMELIKRNRRKFGAHNIELIGGSAPDILRELPPADRVFIGGSGGDMRQILGALAAKSTDCTVCINAVTLESLNAALEGLEELGCGDIHTECVNVAVARGAGGYHMMTAQNPVYIISGRWTR